MHFTTVTKAKMPSDAIPVTIYTMHAGLFIISEELKWSCTIERRNVAHIEDYLQRFNRELKRLIESDLHIGKAVAVFFSEMNHWLRGQITKIIERSDKSLPTLFRVFLIDKGVLVTVTLSQLRHLRRRFTHIKSQAQVVGLHGVMPVQFRKGDSNVWPEECTRRVRKLLESSHATYFKPNIRELGVTFGTIYVHLSTCSHFTLQDYLVAQKMAIPQGAFGIACEKLLVGYGLLTVSKSRCDSCLEEATTFRVSKALYAKKETFAGPVVEEIQKAKPYSSMVTWLDKFVPVSYEYDDDE